MPWFSYNSGCTNYLECLYILVNSIILKEKYEKLTIFRHVDAFIYWIIYNGLICCYISQCRYIEESQTGYWQLTFQPLLCFCCSTFIQLTDVLQQGWGWYCARVSVFWYLGSVVASPGPGVTSGILPASTEAVSPIIVVSCILYPASGGRGAKLHKICHSAKMLQ